MSDLDVLRAKRRKDAVRAPFPYFGGKSGVADLVWRAFGDDCKQYIEPFCGSAAMLLAAPRVTSLEVVSDVNRYIANFWRCIKYQPDATAREADYPVSHVDLDARHRWLTQPDRIALLDAHLADPEWPGDPRVAGWWVWGQCAWIGSGWCERPSKIPHAGNAGRGVQSQIPHAGNAGQGVQSQIPHASDAGQGAFIREWFVRLSARLERVRVQHGDWTRCLNHHYGGDRTAIFFDPPYLSFEKLYAREGHTPVAFAVAEWAAARPELRIAVCGHAGDYDAALVGWRMVRWDRGRHTYGGNKTTANEAIYFSPACRDVSQSAPVLALATATAATPVPREQLPLAL